MSVVFPRNGVSRIFGLHLFPTYLYPIRQNLERWRRFLRGDLMMGCFFLNGVNKKNHKVERKCARVSMEVNSYS